MLNLVRRQYVKGANEPDFSSFSFPRAETKRYHQYLSQHLRLEGPVHQRAADRVRPAFVGYLGWQLRRGGQCLTI